MKTAIQLYPKLCLLLVLLCSCNYYDKAENKKLQLTEMSKTQTNVFTGKFATTFNNNKISVDLTENEDRVTGTFVLNGESFQLNAVSGGTTFSGKITEAATGRFYTVTAQMKSEVLHLFIPFPELNNQIVELQLTKETGASGSVSNSGNQKEKNPALIGTWRHTEVLSSGYGGSYSSLSTDYFVQFKPNGECISWTGSTAGGSQSASVESRGNKNVAMEEWYTEGQNILFVNPNTKQKVSIAFFAEEHRMMLKGKKNRVYVRVK